MDDRDKRYLRNHLRARRRKPRLVLSACYEGSSLDPTILAAVQGLEAHYQNHHRLARALVETGLPILCAQHDIPWPGPLSSETSGLVVSRHYTAEIGKAVKILKELL